jgi:menaquinone-dependent protoporphyrinogen IX oxidase
MGPTCRTAFNGANGNISRKGGIGILIRGCINHSRLLRVLSILLLLLSANTVAFCQAGRNDSAMIKDNRNDIQGIRILIAYQSKYGSTKQYAQWIHQEIKGNLVNIENGDKPDFTGYDIIIIGSSVRIGNIVIAPFIRDRWSVMKGKKVILFTTSATPPRHPKIQSIYEKGLPAEIRKEIKYFPLHGRISRENLTLFDKFLIIIGKIMEQDETLKQDMGIDFDGVQRENLLPLFEYLEDIKTTLIQIND